MFRMVRLSGPHDVQNGKVVWTPRMVRLSGPHDIQSGKVVWTA